MTKQKKMGSKKELKDFIFSLDWTDRVCDICVGKTIYNIIASSQFNDERAFPNFMIFGSYDEEVTEVAKINNSDDVHTFLELTLNKVPDKDNIIVLF